MADYFITKGADVSKCFLAICKGVSSIKGLNNERVLKFIAMLKKHGIDMETVTRVQNQLTFDEKHFIKLHSEALYEFIIINKTGHHPNDAAKINMFKNRKMDLRL